MFGWKETNCIFCNEKSDFSYLDEWRRIFICPNCGVFIHYDGLNVYSWVNNENQKEYVNYPSYLYYHHIDRETHINVERNYIGEEKDFNYFKDSEKNQFKNIKYNIITSSVIKEFIPKTLQRKEELLLQDIYKKRDIVTDIAMYTINEILSASFVIRQKEFADNFIQYRKILLDLQADGYIEIFNDGCSQQFVKVRITTKGIKKVEEIEKGENNMSNTSSGNINNYGNMVLNSNVSGSIVGNGNTSTNFDYEGLKAVISQIEKIYESEESFSADAITQIASDIEEIKTAIQQQNQPVIQKCLNSIKGFVTNVSAGVIASGIWAKIQPFIQLIPGI